MSGAFDFGAFNDSFDESGVTPPLAPPRVRLNPNEVPQIDDHPRPKHNLWQRYHSPNSQKFLLLYRDGRVIAVDNLLALIDFGADDVIAGGHEWYGAPDSWQATVLTAAGYHLLTV